jgi:hypothetical protein
MVTARGFHPQRGHRASPSHSKFSFGPIIEPALACRFESWTSAMGAGSR